MQSYTLHYAGLHTTLAREEMHARLQVKGVFTWSLYEVLTPSIYYKSAMIEIEAGSDGT